MAGVGPAALTDCPRCQSECLGPSVLHCGHLVCRRCLGHLLQGQQESQCPTCSATVKPQGRRRGISLDQFPTDPIMEQLVLEKLKEQMCWSHRSSRANHACLDCGLVLCRSCTAAHRRMRTTSSHLLQSLHAPTPASGSAERGQTAGSQSRNQAAQWNEENEMNQVQDELLREMEVMQETGARLRRLRGEIRSVVRQLERTQDNLRCGQETLSAYSSHLTALGVRSAGETGALLPRLRRVRKDPLSASARDMDQLSAVVNALQGRMDEILWPNQSPDQGPGDAPHDSITPPPEGRSWIPGWLSLKSLLSARYRSVSPLSGTSLPPRSGHRSSSTATTQHEETSTTAGAFPAGPGQDASSERPEQRQPASTRNESTDTRSPGRSQASMASTARSSSNRRAERSGATSGTAEPRPSTRTSSPAGSSSNRTYRMRWLYAIGNAGIVQLKEVTSNVRQSVKLSPATIHHIKTLFTIRSVVRMYVAIVLCALLTAVLLAPDQGPHPSWVNPYLPPAPLSFDPYMVNPSKLSVYSFEEGTGIDDVVMTKDGLLVMPDLNGRRLIVLPPSGLMRFVSLGHRPLSIAQLRDGLFAVATSENKVLVINIDNAKQEWLVRTDTPYCGVAPGNDSWTFLAGTHPAFGGPARIDVLSWPGRVHKTLTDHPFLNQQTNLCYLTVSGDELLVSGRGDYIIRLNVTSGQALGQDRHRMLADVRQIATDRAGNVYMASAAKQSVMVRTRDGRWRRLLAGQRDGHKQFVYPTGVAVSDKRLVVVWKNVRHEPVVVEYGLSA